MTCIEGRLPIHIAAERGATIDKGLGIIFRAEPKAIETRCAKTNLFPFMLAATADTCCIDTIFSLLREAPAVLGHYI